MYWNIAFIIKNVMTLTIRKFIKLINIFVEFKNYLFQFVLNCKCTDSCLVIGLVTNVKNYFCCC